MLQLPCLGVSTKLGFSNSRDHISGDNCGFLSCSLDSAPITFPQSVDACLLAVAFSLSESCALQVATKFFAFCQREVLE